MVLDSVPKIVGTVYALLISVAVAVLLMKGKFNRRVGYALLVVSSFLGFLVFAPMLPVQLQTVLQGNTKQLMAPVGVVIAMLVAFMVLAYLFGRTFCGYACPIGAVQELIHLVPVKKLRIRTKSIPVAFRLAFLGVFVAVAAAFSIGILKYVGIRDFFYLDFTTYWALAFAGLLAVGAVVYRPVCRFLCPYGALLSLPAYGSRFKLIRNDKCIDCGKCEAACPTNEASRRDSRQECYLCHRCIQSCPAQALGFARSGTGSARISDLNHGKVGEAPVPLKHDARGRAARQGRWNMFNRCPGQDQVRVELYKCPKCGAEVEIFSFEVRVKCFQCGEMVYKEKIPSCIEWCAAARQCLGEERWRQFQASKEEESKNAREGERT